MVRGFYVACLVVLCSVAAFSQVKSDPATVTFTLDFPGSIPGHYSFRIDQSGAAHYESSGKTLPEEEQDDSFTYDFAASEATRQKIFDLAAQLGYFQKDLDSHRKNMAFTGKKTLMYKDAQRAGTTTYNYTSDVAGQELTGLFQSLSATLEFGHRLEYAHRYQKLALAEELKKMEESSRTSPIVEVQAIAPILRQIINDPGVINVTRARAQRMLESPPKGTN